MKYKLTCFVCDAELSFEVPNSFGVKRLKQFAKDIGWSLSRKYNFCSLHARFKSTTVPNKGVVPKIKISVKNK